VTVIDELDLGDRSESDDDIELDPRELEAYEEVKAKGAKPQPKRPPIENKARARDCARSHARFRLA
jgi:hypothetical protein